MARAILLLVLLVSGCTGTGTAPANAPSGDPADPGALERAIRAWRSHPGAETEAAVLHAAEEAMAAPARSPELEVLLGDALANILLRPDLGLPYLDRHLETLDERGRDAWLDALLRQHDLPRFEAAAEQAAQVDLDMSHPAVLAIAHQAGRSGEVGWRDLVDGHRAAVLVEETVGRPGKQELDRPVEDVVALAEVLGLLFDEEVELVVARSTAVTDRDPLLSPGAIPVMSDRRRVIGFARSAEADALATVVGVLEQRRPPRGVSIVARFPGGPDGIPVGIDGRFQGDAFHPVATNDAHRATAWLLAAEALREGGDPTAFLDGMLRGR